MDITEDDFVVRDDVPVTENNEIYRLMMDKMLFDEGDVLYDPFQDNSAIWEFFPPNLHHTFSQSQNFEGYTKTVDWVLTHPPHEIPFLTEEGKKYNFFDLCQYYALSNRVKKGMCFLVNYVSYLAITPNRLDFLRNHGFVLSKQIMCNLKNQKGRSFFMIFTRTHVDVTSPAIDYLTHYY